MVSKRKFDSLPANLQTDLRAAATEMQPDWRKSMVEKTTETTAFLKGKDLTFVDVDRSAYRKATQGVYKDFRSIIGADLFDKVIKQVEST
jgi:TRAP-type C4-dicarboxylate transport system substrate-binding protein